LDIDSFLTGGIKFDESEEFLEFRIRFLNAVMLTAVVFSALFIVVNLADGNSIDVGQLRVTALNCLASLALLLHLRGRKHRFTAVAILLAAINFLTYVSALITVTNDEFRLIWFYIEICAVFVLLGQRAGLIITLLTVIAILMANRYLAVPFSRKAMTTVLISLGASGAIGWAYSSRAISCFERMAESNQKLRELATLDPLTNLLNPRAYYDITNRLIRLARRDKTPFSVMFVDLDHFKEINDNFGHESGDRVLRAVANCLAENIRHSDVIGRIGGEEFAVYLPETNLEGAVKLGESIRFAVEELSLILADDRPIGVTVSIGIADNHPADQSIDDIQRRADHAMYQAKCLGRNRVASEEALPSLTLALFA
jgi:diguanylate cyclase (GGDEF)-like protein